MDEQSPAVSDFSVLIDVAAHRLGVSRRTVYYRIREGRLRTIRARCGSQRVLWVSIEALRLEMQALRGKRAKVVPASREGLLSHAQALPFQIQALA